MSLAKGSVCQSGAAAWMWAGIAFAVFTCMPAHAQDMGRGRLLYENNCLVCHYERIHDRDASKSLVKSRAQLRVEVAKWAKQARQPLAPGDLEDIVEYLDRSHYKLAK